MEQRKQHLLPFRCQYSKRSTITDAGRSEWLPYENAERLGLKPENFSFAGQEAAAESGFKEPPT